MLMYHKESKEPVNVHPSQIENMKVRGWTETEKPNHKPKTEVNEDGEHNG